MTLRPGDAVRITVWEKPQLSGEFRVREDGSIADPFYMDVHVGGVTVETAARRVRAHVERFESAPRVLLQPLLRVTITGAVRQPSLYTLDPETTVAQAVMVAGGPTERGRMDRVRLVRGGEELTFDMARPGIGLAQTPIRSGDHILVEYRPNILREYVAPVASVAGAAASILHVILRYR